MAATSAGKVEGSWGLASLARRSILRVASSSSESVGTCYTRARGSLCFVFVAIQLLHRFRAPANHEQDGMQRHPLSSATN